MKANRLFIITGDYSGDIHASRVVAALKRQQPDITIAAVGGENLQAQGVQLVSDQSGMGKMGASSILSAPYHFLLGRRILAFLQGFKPDAVLLVDYGMFNLWMAAQLKKRNIPVFYFIPPQVWASRRSRVKKIQKNVDHVFCIFPFEEPLYQSENIPVTYVGHPLIGEMPPPTERTAFCEQYGLDPQRPIIGIFPGSRKSEINALLPQIIPALSQIQNQRPNGMPSIQFVLAKASSLSDTFFNEQLQAAWKLPASGITPSVQPQDLHLVSDDNYAVMSASNALIAKSGTTTLEAALYKTPMILIYKIHPLVYPIALKIAYLPCLGLPNILTSIDNPPVPELWQDAVNPRQIADALLPLLDSNSSQAKRQQEAFETIDHLLNVGAASENVATAILARLAL